jgi:hypothetical protein
LSSQERSWRHILDKQTPEDLAKRLEKILAFVEAQSNDPGLWFEAEYISEAYLQKALRQLHGVIEGEDLTWLQDGD